MNEAVAVVLRAVALKPDLALAHANLGNVLRDLGRLDDAIEEFGRAIQIKPDYAAAYSNLGNALCDKGRLEDALAVFRRAIELEPGFAPAYSNLGVALEQLNRSEEAAAAFGARSNSPRTLPRLIAILAEALNPLAGAMRRSHRTSAVRLKPDSAPMLCNLGNA